MGEDVVHLPREPAESDLKIGDHRVARQVRARHHQERVGEVRKEEVVQPGVGEHAPDGMEPRDPRVRRMVLLLEHHDRPFPGLQDPPLFFRDDRDPLHLLRGSHHRERLLCPAQPAFQFGGRLLGAGDMKPPYPPDGDDRAPVNEGCRLPDGICGRNQRPVGLQESELRPAGGTGDRLGVVPPAGRVGVLALAGAAHGKLRHRRPLPVVGDGSDDAVPRTAVDAGCGPVALVPSPRREHIGDAVVAGADIGRDESGEAPGAALKDSKRIGRVVAQILDVHGIYVR
ncbi:hypothetical protein DSECCO2_505110 [anaerobic digester metagenome]